MEDKKKPQEPLKVKRIKPTLVQCHIAVPFKNRPGGELSASLGQARVGHDYQMELHPAGVVLRFADSNVGKLVPYTNIQHMDVEFEE